VVATASRLQSHIAPASRTPSSASRRRIGWSSRGSWVERISNATHASNRRPGDRSFVDEVDSIVASWCAGRQRDDLVALLAERGIPCAPVRSVEEVAFDPDVAKRRMLVDIDAPGSGPIKVLGTPVRLSTIDPDVPPRPPPALGEHTDEVLGSIGISATEIRRLREAGAI